MDSSLLSSCVRRGNDALAVGRLALQELLEAQCKRIGKRVGVFINYDAFRTTEIRKRFAGRLHWPLVVADESTMIANGRSERSKAWNRIILPRSERRVCLTGDMTPEGDDQYFNQILFGDKGRLWGRSFFNWREENFLPDSMGGNWYAKDPTDLRDQLGDQQR